jgi:hypothetical protein
MCLTDALKVLLAGMFSLLTLVSTLRAEEHLLRHLPSRNEILNDPDVKATMVCKDRSE